MDIAINNNNDDVTYYNKNTCNVYNKEDIIRIDINPVNYDITATVIKLITNLVSINKGLNKAEMNAFETLLMLKDIKGKDFKDYYCNKYKVSESTAARSIFGLQKKHIVTVTMDDIIKVNSKYHIRKDNIHNVVLVMEIDNSRISQAGGTYQI